MTNVAPDRRSQLRRELDEQIAAEAELPPLDIPADAVPAPVETFLHRARQPRAVAGVVENGQIRPLDPAVKWPERARVIVVLAEAG